VNVSLQTRLLLAASIVLAAFLGLTGMTLDRAFRDSAEAGVRDRLQAHVYALLAAAELAADGQLRLPQALPEARFTTPASGLYAQVFDADGEMIWSSGSTLGLVLDLPREVPAGSRRYATATIADNPSIALAFGTAWENGSGRLLPFTFTVAEDLGVLAAEIATFRRTLWSWLGGAAVLLLLVQGSILRWTLRPLRRVGRELSAIERGQRERLGGDYPPELAPLTRGINRFIAQEQARLQRYRNGLGDLAHSLKTPLSHLRGLFTDPERTPALADEASAQIQRMAEIIEYQLQRAATAGRRPLAAPLTLAPIVAKVVASLDKVHHAKQVACTQAIAGECRYRAEEGDLYELIGNLLDNAYKWCRSRVVLQAETGPGGLHLRVEDDGPGLPEALRVTLPTRGLRADSTTPGHGLGLAMVADLVAAYGGTLTTGSSDLGGACIEVRLPD